MRAIALVLVLAVGCGGGERKAASASSNITAPNASAPVAPATSASVAPATSASAALIVEPSRRCDYVRWLEFNIANVKMADARNDDEKARLLKSVARSEMAGNDDVTVALRQLADAARDNNPEALKKATAHAEEIVARAACNRDPPSSGTVNGRIPPEIIQRIVRKEFGRFKLCYEDALRNDPSTQGRIATKFVIGRDGHVASAEDGGSEGTLSDTTRACIVDKFRKLEFPSPEGGIVTVVYPLIFSPGNQ